MLAELRDAQTKGTEETPMIRMITSVRTNNLNANVKNTGRESEKASHLLFSSTTCQVCQCWCFLYGIESVTQFRIPEVHRHTPHPDIRYSVFIYDPFVISA